MLTDFLVFFGTLLALLVLERAVHRSLQELMLLATADQHRATALYSLVLLPGVVLHEASHAAAALLLGVRVRKVSLLPKRQSNGIQLGFVEINRTNTLRTSIIGAAPLAAGLLALMLIGWFVFDFGKLVEAMGNGNVQRFLDTLVSIVRAPDAVLWFYVVFAVANTMMPSPSDKQGWPPVLIALAIAGVIVLLVGGMDVVRAISPFARATMRWLTAAFVITAFVDVLVVLVLWLAARAVERVSGRRLNYK